MYSSITVPGFAGDFTAMKPGKFSVAINTRFETHVKPGWTPEVWGYLKTKAKQLYAYNYHRAESVTWTLHKVMERAESFSEA